MNNIELLLQAAEYIQNTERRDHGKFEDEHGYASSMPKHVDYPRRRQKTRKNQGNRSTHNELEKNRRANLRHCLEKLKEMVPLGADSTRHTTLGLLVKAKSFIRTLEDKKRHQENFKETLMEKNQRLKRQLDDLTKGQYRSYRVERSLSECSASTSSSSGSTASSALSSSSSGASESGTLGDEYSCSTSSRGSSSYLPRALPIPIPHQRGGSSGGSSSTGSSPSSDSLSSSPVFHDSGLFCASSESDMIDVEVFSEDGSETGSSNSGVSTIGMSGLGLASPPEPLDLSCTLRRSVRKTGRC